VAQISGTTRHRQRVGARRSSWRSSMGYTVSPSPARRQRLFRLRGGAARSKRRDSDPRPYVVIACSTVVHKCIFEGSTEEHTLALLKHLNIVDSLAVHIGTLGRDCHHIAIRGDSSRPCDDNFPASLLLKLRISGIDTFERQ